MIEGLVTAIDFQSQTLTFSPKHIFGTSEERSLCYIKSHFADPNLLLSIINKQYVKFDIDGSVITAFEPIKE